MKRWCMAGFVFLAVLVVLGAAPASAEPDESPAPGLTEGIEDQLNEWDTDQWDGFTSGLSEEGRTFLEGKSIGEWIAQFAAGGYAFDIEDWLNMLLQFFLGQLTGSMGIMVQILAVVFISAILQQLEGNLSKSVSQIAQFACYGVTVILMMSCLASLMGETRDAVHQMTSLMQAMFPVMLAMLSAMGSFSTAGVFQPATAFLTSGIGSLVENFILPLVFLAAVLSVIGNFTDKIRLDKLSGLVKNVSQWSIGIILTVFLGILALQGMGASTFDGISFRTAKYTVNTMIPMVGGMFSDTLETVLGCSLLVKNAIGLVGLILLGLFALAPVVKIVAVIFMLKICSALAQPIADDRTVRCLHEFSSVLVLLVIAVLVVSLMFFLAMCLLINAGNTAVMMR